MSYRVLVSERQFFDDKFTVGDVIKHFAELADLKTKSADMLFYCEYTNGLKVITKSKSDELKQLDINKLAKAIDYAEEYPYVKEDDVEKIYESRCEKDTPVVDKSGKPIYVVMEGYVKENRYYICDVLAGLSNYNLSVNADMTVSCGCMLRKAGQLGDLKTQTLQEIYDSDHVKYLREKLKEGFLPSVSCFMRCNQIKSVPYSMAEYYESNYKVPSCIMFENTSVCNLQCVGCYNAYIDKATVSIEDTIAFAKEVKKNNIKSIFLFKYGETFADRHLGEKLKIIREYNPDVILHVSTNGVLLDKWENIDNAMYFNYLTVSLDGVDDESVSGFQKNGQFETVYSNMKKIVAKKQECGKKTPIITWKYVLFEHNDSKEHIDKAFRLAQEAGVDCLQFLKGFNAENPDTTLWESDYFAKYMNNYKFTFSGGLLTFSLL